MQFDGAHIYCMLRLTGATGPMLERRAQSACQCAEYAQLGAWCGQKKESEPSLFTVSVETDDIIF